MNGYFGALILRSSGIAVGASALKAAGPGVAGIGAAPASAVRPGLEAAGVDHDARPASPASSPSPVIQAPAAVTRLAGPIGRESVGEVEPPSPTTRLRSPEATLAEAPPGDSRFRTALQWIAADPQQRRPPARDAMSTAPGAFLARAAERDDRVAEVNRPLPAARLASPAQPVAVERDSVQVTPSAPLNAHDEITEISIGAIHVRVDAPAAQTVARAAAPNPAVSRAPASSARSSLARRALRRI